MSTDRTPRREDYFARSKKPLHILFFLAPLIVAYEIGAAVFLASDTSAITQDIRAHRLLADFFEAFGVGGFYLPGVALTVVLLLWHVLARHQWKVLPGTLVGMLLESAMWTLPLIVLAQFVVAAPASAAAVALAESGGSLHDLPLAARATIALGAGLYEELLFRLVAITLVHLLLADVIRMPSRWADILAVVAAAAAFGVYHDDHANLAFYFIAGVYFGGLFIARGFGIAVATHAVYDLVALLL